MSRTGGRRTGGARTWTARDVAVVGACLLLLVVGLAPELEGGLPPSEAPPFGILLPVAGALAGLVTTVRIFQRGGDGRREAPRGPARGRMAVGLLLAVLVSAGTAAGAILAGRSLPWWGARLFGPPEAVRAVVVDLRVFRERRWCREPAVLEIHGERFERCGIPRRLRDQARPGDTLVLSVRRGRFRTAVVDVAALLPVAR